MKSNIIYKGKYGATAKYAGWVAEDLQIPAHSADENISLEKGKPEIMILGTSVYIGKLQLGPWLKKNLSYLRGRKIFLFVVSSTPVNEKEKLETYIRAGLPAELRNNCSIYYLPGRLRINDLSWKDRFMLRMGARLARDPKTKKTMLTDYDEVKRGNIAPMIQDIKRFLSQEFPRSTTA